MRTIAGFGEGNGVALETQCIAAFSASGDAVPLHTAEPGEPFGSGMMKISIRQVAGFLLIPGGFFHCAVILRLT